MSTTGAHEWSVAPVAEDRWAEFAAVDGHAFGSTMPDDLVEAERGLQATGRRIGVADDDRLVGIATAYPFTLTVPGGQVPAAGVSWVGVLPTHRRRGILTALMRHQLHAVHEQGTEPLAILWASEPVIYGRYGYGLASRAFQVKVPRSSAALLPSSPSDPGLRLRLADPADWQALAPVYDAVAAVRPGIVRRDEAWWQRTVRDLPSMRDGASEKRAVLVEDGDGVRGYALYRTTQHWDENFGRGDVSVQEVMAADGPALAALYRYLFDLDLMGTTSMRIPVDDPLLHWLADGRAARPELADCLYVRVVDLPRALAARSWSADVDLVLDVTDELCPWNAGTWRLRGTSGTDGAVCEPTDDEPDLALDVRAVGAAYLGGTSLTELAAAGVVDEKRPGAAAAATAAFGHAPSPWTPWVF